MFCQQCGKEIRYDVVTCECGQRLKPQSPALHIFGLVSVVAIPVIGGTWGGIVDGPDVINTVDYALAYVSVIILLLLIFVNRKANKILRITSIVLMSIMTLLSITVFLPAY